MVFLELAAGVEESERVTSTFHIQDDIRRTLGLNICGSCLTSGAQDVHFHVEVSGGCGVRHEDVALRQSLLLVDSD